MANERLVLEVIAQSQGQENIDRLTSAMNRFAAAAETAGNAGISGFSRTTRTVQESATAAEQAAPSWRRLGLAIKDVFEGRSAFAAVEAGYFAQSLGPIAIGAAAAAGAIYLLTSKSKELVEAEKDAAETSKKVGESISEIGGRIKALQIEELTAQFGKIAGLKLSAFYSDLDLQGDRDRVGQITREIENAKKKLAEDNANSHITGNPFIDLNPLITGMKIGNIKDAGLQQSRLDKLNSELDEANSRVGLDSQAEATRKAQEEKDRRTELDKAAKEQREAANRRAEAIEQFREGSLSPVEKIYAGRDSKRSSLKFTSPDEIQTLDVAVMGAVQRELDKQSQEQKKLPLTLSGSGLTNYGYEYKSKANTLGPDGENDLNRVGELVNAALKEHNTEQNRAVNESGTAAVRGVESAGADADRRIEMDLRLSAAQKIAALNARDLETAKEKYRIELDGAARQATIAEQNDARHRADLAYEGDLQKIKEQNVERLAELENKRIEDFSHAVGGLFNSAFSGGRGIEQFLKSQALNFATTVVENIAKDKIYPAIKPHLPTSDNPLFRGTGLYDATKGLKTPTGTELDPVFVKSADLPGAGGGSTGSSSIQQAISRGFGSGSSGGSVFGALSTDDSGNSTGDSSGDIGDGLPMDSTGMNHGVQPVSFGGSAIGKNLALGAAAGGGAFAAFNDFKTGGAKNDVAGAGALLGSAAAVAAMIPGGQIVALGLGIASAATSIISGLMPDPKAVRAAAIQKALTENTYNAPTALNASMDTSGNYTDLDSRGMLRTSSLRGMPQVSEPYTYWGPNNTPYSVPGGQTSPYSQWSGGGAPVAIHIHAIDTESSVDFLRKNPTAIADAFADHLTQGAPSRATQAIQFITSN